jgi:hypothetical protein
MAVAMIYPEPEKRGRGNKSAAIKAAEISGFSERYIQQARVIVQYARDHVQDVMSGAMPSDIGIPISAPPQF